MYIFISRLICLNFFNTPWALLLKSIPKPIDLWESFYLLVTLNSEIQISNKKKDGAAMLCALEECHASFTCLRKRNITACWNVVTTVGHFIPWCLLSLQLTRDAGVNVCDSWTQREITWSVNNPAYIFGIFMSAWEKKGVMACYRQWPRHFSYSKLMKCLEG